jgi:hypothetical protein
MPKYHSIFDPGFFCRQGGRVKTRYAFIGHSSMPIRVDDGKRHNSFWWYTIILNHPRGWGGKPKGLTETAGLPNVTFSSAPAFLRPDPEIIEKGT